MRFWLFKISHSKFEDGSVCEIFSEAKILSKCVQILMIMTKCNPASYVVLGLLCGRCVVVVVLELMCGCCSVRVAVWLLCANLVDND